MICCSSCGLCCSAKYLCENCLGHTLQSSGLADTPKNRDRIREKEKENRNNFDRFGASELAYELRKMHSEVEAAREATTDRMVDALEKDVCIVCRIYAPGNLISEADKEWSAYGCPDHTMDETCRKAKETQ